MASIFKTLEGGHLDRALFSSQVEEGKKDGNDAEQTPLFSRLRRIRRGKKHAKTGGKRTGPTRSDTRL